MLKNNNAHRWSRDFTFRFDSLLRIQLYFSNLTNNSEIDLQVWKCGNEKLYTHNRILSNYR